MDVCGRPDIPLRENAPKLLKRQQTEDTQTHIYAWVKGYKFSISMDLKRSKCPVMSVYSNPCSYVGLLTVFHEIDSQAAKQENKTELD